MRMRWLISFVLACVFITVFQVLGVLLCAVDFSILIMPSVIIFAAFYLTPIAGSLLMLAMGLVIDSLSGFSLGLNSLLLLIAWFVTSLSISYLGNPSRMLLFVCGICVSLGYRLCILIFSAMFGSIQSNFMLGFFLAGALLDGFVVLGYVRLAEIILTKLKVMESADTNLLVPEPVQ